MAEEIYDVTNAQRSLTVDQSARQKRRVRSVHRKPKNYQLNEAKDMSTDIEVLTRPEAGMKYQ